MVTPWVAVIAVLTSLSVGAKAASVTALVQVLTLLRNASVAALVGSWLFHRAARGPMDEPVLLVLPEVQDDRAAVGGAPRPE